MWPAQENFLTHYDGQRLCPGVEHSLCLKKALWLVLGISSCLVVVAEKDLYQKEWKIAASQGTYNTGSNRPKWSGGTIKQFHMIGPPFVQKLH